MTERKPCRKGLGVKESALGRGKSTRESSGEEKPDKFKEPVEGHLGHWSVKEVENHNIYLPCVCVH